MSETENKDEILNEEYEGIKDLGGVEIDNSKGKFFCISIIGQIEGHNVLPSQTKTTKYEHILPKLISVEENEKIDGLLVILNTVGGDIEAGLAIAEVIAGMKKPTVSLVLGGGHSIGVPLAVSADVSFIVPSATMTIHPVRTSGTIIGVPQMFNYLYKIQDRIIDFVVKHSNIERDDLMELLLETDEIANDVGTVLFGEEAVECGIIDKVGGISDACNTLYELIKKAKK
ncbi:MAG: translocation-enhancing protein TepA [Ruminococcaceae bacterium]|nr:translocation-enhancing protein TepA [Oscillospiraceae bacterium]